MKKHLLMILVAGALVSCVSGTKSPDSYVGKDGQTTLIESNSEMCKRSCNEDYSRCMDSRAAGDNSGVIGPSGVFGASGECRNALKNCLSTCKGL